MQFRVVISFLPKPWDKLREYRTRLYDFFDERKKKRGSGGGEGDGGDSDDGEEVMELVVVVKKASCLHSVYLRIQNLCRILRHSRISFNPRI